MIIGTFTSNDNGGFTGVINTAGLNLAGVAFETKDKGADFVLKADHNGQAFEIGGAWKKSGDYGDYLSVRLDSPTFAEPVNATMKLKASDTGVYALRWNRRKDEDQA